MKPERKIKKVKREEAKNEKAFPGNPVQSRRDFLGKLWKALGIAAAAEFTAVFLGFLFSGKKENERSELKPLFDAGNAGSFKSGSVTLFRGGRFYLVKMQDGGFLALSLRCTHLGCSINWEEEKKRFICPCHSSAFDIGGNVENPPAPSALDYFPLEIHNGKVMIDTGTKLNRSRFSKDQAVYI